MSAIRYSTERPKYESDVFVVEVNGSGISSYEDMAKAILKGLGAPSDENPTVDGYLDWMRDLSWISRKGVRIVIFDGKEAMRCYGNERANFKNDLLAVVFPFWGNDAKEVFGFDEFLKDVEVVFVDSEFVSELNRKANLVLFGNVKIPHRVSFPVLRKEGDRFVFAVFAFFFDGDGIRAGRIGRPTVWAEFDLETGDLIGKWNAGERDFSDAGFDEKYDVHPDGTTSLSNEEIQELFGKLDRIRADVLDGVGFDEDEYRKYLESVVSGIPLEYRRFYFDLSL